VLPGQLKNDNLSDSIKSTDLQVEVNRRQQASLQLQGRPLNQMELGAVLEGDVGQKLIALAAKREGITVTDSEIKKQFRQNMEQEAGQAATAAQFNTALLQNAYEALGKRPTDAEYAANLDRLNSGRDVQVVNDFFNQMRPQLVMQKYVLHKRPDFQNLPAKVKVTDAMVEKAYISADVKEKTREEYITCYWLTIPFGRDKSAAKKVADGLVHRIGRDAAKFDNAYIEGNTASSSFHSQGNVRYDYLLSKDWARQAFGKEDIVRALFDFSGSTERTLNKVYPLFEGPNSFYIIKVGKVYPPVILKLTDSPVPVTGGSEKHGTLADLIHNQLAQQQLMKLQDDLMKEVIAPLQREASITYDNNALQKMGFSNSQLKRILGR
jgi:hypothetical protein